MALGNVHEGADGALLRQLQQDGEHLRVFIPTHGVIRTEAACIAYDDPVAAPAVNGSSGPVVDRVLIRQGGSRDGQDQHQGDRQNGGQRFLQHSRILPLLKILNRFLRKCFRGTDFAWVDGDRSQNLTDIFLKPESFLSITYRNDTMREGCCQ